ncbi:hypothetical protein ACP70R_017696 [Stipagrostis hirtigluma subsp. patula]
MAPVPSSSTAKTGISVTHERSRVPMTTKSAWSARCNCLLCLQERQFADGRSSTITVTNPITGETRALPPLRHGAEGEYSFGYHPTTGQYKVVHVRDVPWRQDRAAYAVQVFTHGDTSWRGVPALTASARSYYQLCESHQRRWVDILAHRDLGSGDGAGPRGRACHVLGCAADCSASDEGRGAADERPREAQPGGDDARGR